MVWGAKVAGVCSWQVSCRVLGTGRNACAARFTIRACATPLPSPQLRVFHGHPQGVVSVKFTTLVRGDLLMG